MRIPDINKSEVGKISMQVREKIEVGKIESKSIQFKSFSKEIFLVFFPFSTLRNNSKPGRDVPLG